MKVLRLFPVFLFIFSYSLALSADNFKVGVFDMQTIIDESNAGKKAKDTLQKLSNSMQKQVTDLKEEAEALEEEIRNQASVLSKDKREEKIRSLRIMENDFNYLKKKFTSEIQSKEREMTAKLNKDIIQIVKKMGKDGKFDIVIEKREAGIVYFNEKCDITEKIIKEYDRKK